MIGARPSHGVSSTQRPGEPGLPNGRIKSPQPHRGSDRIIAGWDRFGPDPAPSVLLILGISTMRQEPPTRLSPEHYRAWAFPAFRYSDLIWLYLRDGARSATAAVHRFPAGISAVDGLASRGS